MILRYIYDAAANKMFGIPSTTTDAKGTETTQAIDVFGRQTNVSVANTSQVGYTYSGSLLSAINRTGVVNNQQLSQSYTFGYDAFGNMTSVKAGNYTLATYEYGANNGPMTRQNYGNGAYVNFAYDNLGRNKTTTYSGGRTLTYAYTGDGRLYSINDNTLGKYVYTYDTLGRLIASQRFNTDGSFVLGTNQTYNANNQLMSQSWKIGTKAYTERYSYNTSDGSLASMTSGTGETLTYNYDSLRRLSGIDSTENISDRTYVYEDISNTQTTTQVKSLTYPTLKSGYSFLYTYDEVGNIASYELSCVQSSYSLPALTYEYDAQGQLTKVKRNGTTLYSYTYDGFGNIKTANGHTYTYGNASWRDLLTAYDGESISYDNSGNPTSYYNGTHWEFTWAEGRNLVDARGGGHTVSYTYDHNGVRTTKTVDGVLHTYTYASGKLLREVYGTTVLDFFYDASGTPVSMRQSYTNSNNYTVYYYITNLQGDVIRLVDKNGNTAAYYNYDPYGKVIEASGSHANINPLRYRSYYYDTETQMYYLQSRYYDPQICRFINADKHPSTGQGLLGNNMFAYCNNNPVIAADHNGEWLNIVIGAGIGALAGLVGQVISDVITSVITQTPTVSNWQTYAGAAIGGAAGGVVLATTANVNAANAVTGFATTGAAQTLEKITGINDRSWEEIGTNSARDGAVSLALGSFLSGIPNVTTGKNSMMAVYQSGLTKLRNDVAKTMSTSVMTKGFIASVAGGLYLDGYYGLKQASSAN